ncbi:MAG: TonB C-terminal domain-containing protein [Acidobacteria bacterium]|nr:TonB C-terminal domain-containing protein [Acidobacteriota bacterium]
MDSLLLRPHTALPGLPGSLLRSVALHIALLATVWILPIMFPAQVLILGTGTGGGQGGETLHVGLTGSLDGGSGELFKPSLKPQPPATPMPEQVKGTRAELAPKKDDFLVQTPKAGATKKPVTPASGTAAELSPELLAKILKGIINPETPPNQIPRETGPGMGGSGRTAGGGGEFGGGEGIHIGTGSGGEGLMDSWYARQVEKRIGENWIRTNFESLAGRHLVTTIRFDILSDGRIDNIVMEQRSGVTFYDLAAERAIRSSTPLPRPPQEFQGRPIRFVCYFEYPPPKGQ